MCSQEERGRGGSQTPRAEDPRLQVSGWRDQIDYHSIHLGMTIGRWGDVITSSTHFVCRREFMALYDGSSGVWLVMEECFPGEESRQEELGGDMSRALFIVSRLTTCLGYSGVRNSGKRAGASPSCKTVSAFSYRVRGTMAPKRSAPHLSRTASGRVCTREMTKEQEKAAHSAKHYKRTVPPEIQADIAKVEEGVWEEVHQGIPEPEFNDLASWIHDPGKTYGRIGLYQRAISYYWASKCLLAKTLVEQKQTGMEKRAGVPVPLWDNHYNETRLMHKKLDVLAFKLGIKFIAPEATFSAKATARAGEGKRPQQVPDQVP